MTATAKLKIWIDACRPKTLPAAVCPVLIGAAMASVHGPINKAVLTVTFLAALMIQIGTNLANDYFDSAKGADTPDRVGPVRATASGLVSAENMLRATVMVFFLAALLGLYLTYIGGKIILVIGILSMTCGVLYTAGPFALGYMGLGDLFVLIFFGPVAVAGTFYLQRQTCHWQVIMASLAPGLISMAILTVNNFRDRFTDQQAGKRTLVVRLGAQFGINAYAMAIMGACMTPVLLVLLCRDHYYCLLGVLSLIPGVPMIRTIQMHSEPEILNQLLARTGKLLVIYSILFSIGWVL